MDPASDTAEDTILNSSMSSFETHSQTSSDGTRPRYIRHLSTGSDLYLSAGYDFVMKIILLGDQGVGKSSFMRALLGHPEVTTVKCGCRVASPSDHLEMEVATGQGKTAFIRLFDTGGQERYRSLTSSYYRGAHGVLLMFDVTNRKSLDNIETWLSDLDAFSSSSSCVRVVLGSKCGSRTREVTEQAACKYTESRSMPYMEMDANSVYNVVESLRFLVDRIAKEATFTPRQTIVITPRARVRRRTDSSLSEKNVFTCIC